MARLLVLSALSLAYLGLKSEVVEVAGAFNPVILAAIGFVILASYTAAEMGSLLTLPRVSGYIAAGVVLGPSVTNVLSAPVVDEMTMFNTLALGLIAMGAGLELELKTLRSLWRSLSATVLSKVVLSGGLVFGTFVAAQKMFGTLALTSNSEIFAVGLVLATVSVGTSPAIVLAVINELGAKGRVAELALGAAVIKDFVLVVLLAVALAVGGSLVGSGAHGGEGIAAMVGKELAASVVVGIGVGLVTLFYVRFVATEMLLFVAALVLAVHEISVALHLDALLVFIVAGFIVRNFSKRWEMMLHALETVALPVFVVYFTIAGALIDLDVTYRVLPMASLLCVARALGFFGASRIGAWAAGDSREVAQRTFLAYLPQAGVTLTLCGLAAERLPGLGSEIMAIGVATVALNLMIGPVTLRLGLQEPKGGAEEISSSDPASPEDDANVVLVKKPLSRPARVDSLTFAHMELKRPVLALERDLERLVKDVLKDHLEVHAQALSNELASVLLGDDEHLIMQRMHSWGRQQRAKDVVSRAEVAARDFHAAFQQRLSEVSAEIVVDYSPEMLRKVAGDGLRLRLRKARARVAAWMSRRARTRHVPLRLACRYALTPRFSQLSLQLMGAICRSHGLVLGDLRRTASRELSIDELADSVTTVLSDLLRNFRSDAQVALGRGLLEVHGITEDIDSPTRSLKSLRYSEVEPEARRYTEALSSAPEAWTRALTAAEGGLALATALSRVGHAVETALEREVLMPLAEAAEDLEPAVAAAKFELNATLQAVRDNQSQDRTLQDRAQAFAKLRQQRELEGPVAVGSFRASAALHAANVELRQLVDSLPEQLRVPAGRNQAAAVTDPDAFLDRVVSLRAEARRMLLHELVPTVDLEGGRAAGSVQDLEARRAEAIEMSESAIDALIAGELGQVELEETLERALSHLTSGQSAARTQLIAAHDAIAKQLADALVRMSDLTARGGREVLAFASAPIAPLARLREAGQETLIRAKFIWRKLRAQWSELMGAELTQHLKTELASAHDLKRFFSADSAQLPAVYSRLFRLDPLRDLRLSAARESELDKLLRAERGWLAGGASSALVVGAPGAGRTTLLNLAQSEFTAPRLIRPVAVGLPRDLGLTRALAYELGRRPTRKDVAAGLATHRTAVILDDLEHWFEPGADGLVDLRNFLDLVLRTHRDVFWAVSASEQWVELMSDVVPVADVFGATVPLPALDARALRKVIETRHVLSGMEMRHGQHLLSKVLGRVREDSDAEITFRLLHSVTGGNLQAALAAWSRAVTVQDGVATVLPHRLLLERLPNLSELDPPLLALLMQLIRFGPQDPRRLCNALGATRRDVTRLLRLLENVGLLVRPGKNAYGIDPDHRHRLLPRLPLVAERRG